MRTAAVVAVALAVLSRPLAAQEKKPVPKDSVRVTIPGCTKGYIFTVGPRTPDETSGPDIPRRHASPDEYAEKDDGANQGSRGVNDPDYRPDEKRRVQPGGVGIGGGVRVTPGPSDRRWRQAGSPAGNQVLIDVESWGPFVGGCPGR